jgi:hypothetical protein
MDRREFFKTVFASSILAPFLLGSPSSANDELFIISDSPELYLPSLLEKLGNHTKPWVRSYTMPGTHPRNTALSLALKTSGWTKTSPGHTADLILSFRPLEQPSPPSFTLVKAGKIVDIRTKELYSFWREMNEAHPPSSCLTVAALQARQPSRSPGTFVRIFHNGHLVEEVSLKKDRIWTFSADKGKVTVKIEQGKAFVPSSSCRHKICCSVPPAALVADRIVCAPNHFLLEVRGSSSIDTIIG